MNFDWPLWVYAIGLVAYIPLQIYHGHEAFFGYQDIGPEDVAFAKERYVAALAEFNSFRRQHGMGSLRLGGGH